MSVHRMWLLLGKPLVVLLAIAMHPVAATAGQGLLAFPAAGPEPGIDAARASLRVTVAPTIADAALLTAWLEERNADMGKALVLAGHDQWIAVRIDGATYEYDVSVTAMRDGAPLAPSEVPIRCECNSESLLVMLDREISAAVYRLRSTPVEDPKPEPTRPAMVPAPAPAPSPAPAPARERAQPRSRTWSISPLGIAGAATGAFGLIALGTGSALAVAEPRPIDGWSKLERDFAPLGYATVAVGTAALLGGVAMIVVDAIRVRRRSELAVRRSGGRTLAVTLNPAFERGSVGATVFRRF